MKCYHSDCHTTDYISLVHFFHQIFVLSQIQSHFYIHTPCTSKFEKFKVPQILPGTLSPTQIEPKEPKRSKIDPHLDHETAVHMLFVDPACRCFDLACTDLAHLSPNRATHLKSPKNTCDLAIAICIQTCQLLISIGVFAAFISKQS